MNLSTFVVCIVGLYLVGCTTTDHEAYNETDNKSTSFSQTYISVYRWGDSPHWPEITQCGESFKAILLEQRTKRNGAHVNVYLCKKLAN